MENNLTLSIDLKDFIVSKGAIKVGFCSTASIIKDETFSRAISFLMPLQAAGINGIKTSPNTIYSTDYERLNNDLTTLSNQIIDFLEQRGFRASAIEEIIGSLDKTAKATEYPHKTFAFKAGLGWIGKSSLLVTKEYGSAFRMATILTDAPLKVNVTEYKNYCGSCQVCRDTCPVSAIKGITWKPGVSRDTLFDAEKCFDKIKEYMHKLNTDSPVCGICMRNCPWTDYYLKRTLKKTA